ncbi:MAG: hypothetical protein ACFFBD_25345 [Candidatus Hodarchaeota archaeon]
MRLKIRRISWIFLTGWLMVSLFITPTSPGLSSSDLELVQIPFVVNETFALNSTQIRSYPFIFRLNRLGTHARVRVQGGIVTGQTPTSLDILITLDGFQTNQTFRKNNGLQKYYTFHSSSEYVIQIPLPIRPVLDEIETVHNLTVELTFMFTGTPDGLGVVHQIIFETFTPPPLSSSEARAIILVQDEFSWKLGLWSFGRCFFNTSMLIPLSNPQKMSLQATLEVQGIELEGWILSIRQNTAELYTRNNQTLEGIIELDPNQPCEVSLSVDPPQVSDTEFIIVRIDVQGTILPDPETLNSNISITDPVSEKRLIEGLMFVQLAIVFTPLLVFYRIHRPYFKPKSKEEK